MANRSKRKRAASSALTATSSDGESSARMSQLPPESINPRSYSPATLRQLPLAGLSERDLLPSEYQPGFPHRPLASLPPRGGSRGRSRSRSRHRHSSEDESQLELSGASSEEESSKKTAHRAAALGVEGTRRYHDRHLGRLASIIRACLQSGDVPRAKRAFAALLRSQVRGRPVDLRVNGYWALGAEVLMREGEIPAEPDGDGGSSAVEQGRERGGGGVAGDEAGSRGRRATQLPQRWGSADNMPRVREYFETLIYQHPWNRVRPNVTSAVDFWPALLGCEVYNVYIERELALRRLETGGSENGGGYNDGELMDYEIEGEEEEDEEDDDEQRSEEEEGKSARAGLSRRERLHRRERDKIRLEALREMRRIATRMDDLMVAVPYSAHQELFRLRGTVALYMGDLALAPPPRSAREEEQGSANRREERARAVRMFRRMMELGGEPDKTTTQLLREEDDENETSRATSDDGITAALPSFLSLPIREH